MANPNWKKGGVSGNPGGRPSTARAELIAAIKIASAANGDVTPLQNFVNKSYTSEAVLIALMKKMLPDMTETELGESTLSALITEICGKRDKLVNDRSSIQEES
jgi:hypothetical protein